MARRFLALFVAALFVSTTLAPSLVLAAGASAPICSCPMHDHCATSAGKHVCSMKHSAPVTDGPAIVACDASSFLAVPAALAPILLAAPPALEAPQIAVRLSPPLASSLLRRASPPDAPPPRA